MKVDSVTKTDAFPLPRKQDCLDAVSEYMRREDVIELMR